MSTVIFAHHGQGGGSTPEAAVRKLRNAMSGWEGIDVAIIGHFTQQGINPLTRIRPVWGARPRLKDRTIPLVAAGGFYRGFVEGNKFGETPRGNFVEQGMMNPTYLGCPIIHLTPTRTTKDGLETIETRVTVET